MTVEGGTVDGTGGRVRRRRRAADGVVVRERRSGEGGGGLRALTVGTTGVRCGRCTKIFFGDRPVPAQNTFEEFFFATN